MSETPNPADVARDAWIYAYPMLMSYQTLYSQAIDTTSSGYTGGFNVFRNYALFFTPENRDIVTPNNDTPYSWAWLDLRTEPIVLSMPDIPAGRYNVMQLIDLFTYNFAYVGTRTTGHAAGSYLIAGPGWNGAVPPGIKQVLHADTSLVLVLGRTSLADQDDIPALQALQAQYRLTPLSAFAGTEAPAPAQPINFMPWNKEQALGIGFIGYLNQLLSLARTPPFSDEADLMKRFATIGIAPGSTSDTAGLAGGRAAAIEAGVKNAAAVLHDACVKTTSSMHLFGTRAMLGTDYLTRAVAAAMGLFGNTSTEAVYTGGETDANGNEVDGAKRYTLTFPPGQAPPVTEFWSVTMYDLPDRFLVANPIGRYSLGDRSGIVPAPDGSLTIYLQAQSPGPEYESNWLPSPTAGPWSIVIRLYGPKSTVFDGTWKTPPIVEVIG